MLNVCVSDSTITTSTTLKDNNSYKHAFNQGSCVTSNVAQKAGTSMPLFGTYNMPLNSSPAAPLNSMQGPCSENMQTLIDEMNTRYINCYTDKSPPPIRKGEFLSVNIDDLVHKQGDREHEKSLIARVMLKPKVEPISSVVLQNSINKIWDVPGH